MLPSTFSCLNSCWFIWIAWLTLSCRGWILQRTSKTLAGIASQKERKCSTVRDNAEELSMYLGLNPWTMVPDFKRRVASRRSTLLDRVKERFRVFTRSSFTVTARRDVHMYCRFIDKVIRCWVWIAGNLTTNRKHLRRRNCARTGSPTVVENQNCHNVVPSVFVKRTWNFFASLMSVVRCEVNSPIDWTISILPTFRCPTKVLLEIR